MPGDWRVSVPQGSQHSLYGPADVAGGLCATALVFQGLAAKTTCAGHDAVRDADEVGIGKAVSGAEVAIIQQDVDAGGL